MLKNTTKIVWEVKNFYQKIIDVAKKPHYITPMISQPQHISFIINNRLCVGRNFYANPFVILLFYFTYLEFNFFRLVRAISGVRGEKYTHPHIGSKGFLGT